MVLTVWTNLKVTSSVYEMNSPSASISSMLLFLVQNTIDVIRVTNTWHRKWKDNVKKESHLFTDITIQALIMEKPQYALWSPSVINVIALW